MVVVKQCYMAIPCYSHTEGDWKIWITTGSEESMATSNMVFLYAYGTKGSAGPLRMGSGKDGFFRAGTTEIIKVGIQDFHWNIHRMLINIGNSTCFIDNSRDYFKFELDIGQSVSVPVFFNISSVFDCFYRNTICLLVRLNERFLILVLYRLIIVRLWVLCLL